MNTRELVDIDEACDFFNNVVKNLTDYTKSEIIFRKSEGLNMRLRELINELEKLSENGKNDNIKVALLDYNDIAQAIGWIGIDTVYPTEEIEECNPQNGEKMVLIQF